VARLTKRTKHLAKNRLVKVILSQLLITHVWPRVSTWLTLFGSIVGSEVYHELRKIRFFKTKRQITKKKKPPQIFPKAKMSEAVSCYIQY
jgi:hypothetical protein